MSKHKTSITAIILSALLITGNAPVPEPVTPPTVVETLNSPIEFVEKPVVQPVTPDKQVTTYNFDKQQIDCLARVISHEARGEGERGQKAVGYVVVNRSKSKRFPGSICKVATQRHQFTNFSLSKPVKQYQHFYSLAQDIVSKYSKANDPTNGALFFHSRHIRPQWKLLRTVTISNHVFYR